METDKFYGMLCLVGNAGALQANNDASYPELHLNLWEHVDQVFLDVGLRIKNTFPFHYIYFYFPWRSQDGSIVDLTPTINSAVAVAAIFNESWQVTQLPHSSAAIVRDPTTGRVQFQIVGPDKFLSIDYESNLSHRLTLDFRELVRTEHIEAEDIYIRFRVKGVPKEFYAVGLMQGDKGLVSSWTKNEFLDFRLNVRRGAPPGLESKVGRFLSFSKVHLFLMRHRSYELVFQDSAFKSCRSLEDEDFWANYSHVGHESSQNESIKKAYVADSLGYQWTKRRSVESPVDEFGILARFKRIELSVLTFLVFVVVFGAAGNATWDLVTWLGSKLANLLFHP